MYKVMDIEMKSMLKLIYYFRMSKHVRSHTKKDDPRPSARREEDGASLASGLEENNPTNPTNLTYQIEEAMEEDNDTACASQATEGDAGSNASSLYGLSKGGVPQWSTQGMKKLLGQCREK